jgi:secreted trypsin-like serine protease
LPKLFQDDLLCAGNVFGTQGACQGDDGGPLMIKQLWSEIWTQIAIVQGVVGDCGDPQYPAITVRLDHPKVLSFIKEIID